MYTETLKEEAWMYTETFKIWKFKLKALSKDFDFTEQ